MARQREAIYMVENVAVKQGRGLTQTEIRVGTLCHRVYEAIPNGKGVIGYNSLVRELAQLVADEPGAIDALERIQSERTIVCNDQNRDQG